MHIIPVIDLKDGFVVSAKQGRRNEYQPIQSKLSPSSYIEDILTSFLSIHAFKTIYIADLNAITNSGDNQTLIEKVISENRDIEFWVDKGTKLENLSEYHDTNHKPVIGSEYQNSSPKTNIMQNSILSLDFFPGIGYKGPKYLLKNPDLWPQRIILMTLERVGSNMGPDIEKLKFFCENFPDKTFIAAGGVQNEKDLINIKKTGVNHTLIASALHTGKLSSEIIAKLQTKKCPD